MTDALWQLGGWTMLHFLWLGTIIAMVGAILRFTCRRGAPAVRYATSLLTLAALAATPIAIAAWLAVDSPAILAGRAVPVASAEAMNTKAPSQVATGDSPEPMVIDLAFSDPPERTNATAPIADRVANPSPDPAQLSSPQASLRGRGITLATFVAYMPWIWLIGAPLTFALLAAGLVGSERLRRSSTELIDGAAAAACERLRLAMHITRRVSVAVCDRLAQPVLIGILRPLILLPASALSGWTPEELEMVLVHELAHVRRWDNLVNLVQRIVESLLFFHPAVWLASRQVRRDREECCDATVVAHTARPEAYATLLVSIAAKMQARRPAALAAASAMADHPLAGRIRRILKLEDEPMWISRRTLVLSLVLPLLLAYAALYAGAVAGQDSPPAKEETSVTRERADVEPATIQPTPVISKTYGVSHAHRPYVERWLETLSAEDSVESGWEGPHALVITGPAKAHAQLATLLDKGEKETLENAKWRTAFATSSDNPVQTVAYEVHPKAREQFSNIADAFEGLEKDPYGPMVRIEWEWADDKKHILVAIPRKAHQMLFQRNGLEEFLKSGVMPEAPPAGDDSSSTAASVPGAASSGDADESPLWFAENKDPAPTRSTGFRVFKLAHARASVVSLNLEEYFEKELTAPGEGPKLRFIWDADSNTIIVQNATEEQLENIQKLVQVYDQPPAGASADYQLQPGDQVKIQVVGAFPDAPIDDVFVIEPAGTVALGATYGRAAIAGLTVLEAEEAVKNHLKSILTDLQVQITLSQPPDRSPRQTRNATAVIGAEGKKVEYLYDGKTFDQWRDLWMSELKTERRTETIEAFAAFARTGRAKEAAEAILDVAGEYDFSRYWMDEVSSESHLRKAIAAALNPSGKIPATIWLPLMRERIAKNPQQWLPMLEMIFRDAGELDPTTRNALLKMASESGPSAAYLRVLHSAGLRDEPKVQEFTKAALTGDDGDNVLSMLEYVDLMNLDDAPERLAPFFHKDPEIRRRARTHLAGRGAFNAAGIAEHALAVLEDPQRSQDHVDALRLIAAIQMSDRRLSSGDSATGTKLAQMMTRLIKEAPPELLPAVLVASGRRGSQAVEEWLNSRNDQVTEQRRALLLDVGEALEKEVQQVAEPRQVGGFVGGGGRSF